MEEKYGDAGIDPILVDELPVEKVQDHLEVIVELLVSGDCTERFSAARALGSLGRVSLRYLGPRLGVEKDDLVLAELVEQIGGLEAGEGCASPFVAFLERLARNHPTFIVRSAAITSLTEILEDEVSGLLEEIKATSPTMSIRSTIAVCKAWLDDQQGLADFREVVRSGDIQAMRRAVNLFSTYRPSGLLQEVATLLKELRSSTDDPALGSDTEATLNRLLS